MYQLTDKEKQYINQGGVISEPGTEKQQAYSDYVKSTSVGTITGNLLNPVTGIAYTNPASTPTSPVTVPIPKANELSQPQQQESNLNTQLQQLNDIIVGKPTYEQQQREQFGVSAKEATKQSIINQLGQLKAYTENIPAQLQAESEGRGRTATGITPIETGRLRQAGIQANVLNANYAAAQGDLALAETHVQQAVNDKFAPYEATRNALLNNLNLIKTSPEYTLAEKTRAQAQENKIKAQDAEKERVKTVFNDIIKLSTSVSSSSVQNANTNLAIKQINDLANSINYDNSTGKPLTTDKEAIDLLTKAQGLAQKYISKQPTGQSDFEQAFQRTYGRLPNLQELQNYENQKKVGTEISDNETLNAYAQQYSATGQIPVGLPKGTFGQVASLAKELPKPTGAIVDINTNVKSSKVSQTLESGFASMYSVVELAQQLKELDKQRIGGIVAGSLGKVFGSTAQQRYIDLQTQISDLLARARTGAAINATEEDRYFKMLPGRLSNPFGLGASSQSRIDNFIKNVSSDLDAKTRTQGLAIYGFSKVKVGNQEYKVGDVIQNSKGQTGIIHPDGTVSIIQ